MNPELLKQLSQKNTSGFNYQLPSGDVIQTTVNPLQAATVSVEGVLSGKVASDIPQEILDIGRTQLVGKTPIFDPRTAVVSPAGIEATKQNGALEIPKPTLTPEQIKDYYTKYGSAANPPSPQDYLKQIQTGAQRTTTGVSPTAPTVTGVGSLMQNTELAKLDKTISDISSRLSAGISAGGSTEILTGLFKQFGVSDEISLLNSYNQQILETQTRLRKIPEDLKTTLADVGVSESQLNRLILKETEKPQETLRNMMEQKGVAQDAINQSLRFVGLFSDAAMADKAAKLEALKFDLTQATSKYKELKDDQKNLVDKVLADQKDKLSLANSLLLKGASPDLIAAVQNVGSYAEAMQLAQPFISQRASIDVAKDVAGGIADTIAGMSDKQALTYVQQRAAALGIDMNTLLDAVAGKEKTSGGKSLDILDIGLYK